VKRSRTRVAEPSSLKTTDEKRIKTPGRGTKREARSGFGSFIAALTRLDTDPFVVACLLAPDLG
jgi:hypothetical protein